MQLYIHVVKKVQNTLENIIQNRVHKVHTPILWIEQSDVTNRSTDFAYFRSWKVVTERRYLELVFDDFR